MELIRRYVVIVELHLLKWLILLSNNGLPHIIKLTQLHLQNEYSRTFMLFVVGYVPNVRF